MGKATTSLLRVHGPTLCKVLPHTAKWNRSIPKQPNTVHEQGTYCECATEEYRPEVSKKYRLADIAPKNPTLSATAAGKKRHKAHSNDDDDDERPTIRLDNRSPGPWPDVAALLCRQRNKTHVIP